MASHPARRPVGPPRHPPSAWLGLRVVSGTWARAGSALFPHHPNIATRRALRPWRVRKAGLSPARSAGVTTLTAHPSTLGYITIPEGSACEVFVLIWGLAAACSHYRQRADPSKPLLCIIAMAVGRPRGKGAGLAGDAPWWPGERRGCRVRRQLLAAVEDARGKPSAPPPSTS
jgi:hypothetical protein